jgi:hypothetical protein
MNGPAKLALVLGLLCVSALTSPASGRTTAPADVGAQCRAQANAVWDPLHGDCERHRTTLGDSFALSDTAALRVSADPPAACA